MDEIFKVMHDSMINRMKEDPHFSFDLSEYEKSECERDLVLTVVAEQFQRLEDRIALLETWRSTQDDYSYEQRDST